ncbi:MAG TPA: MBL fold metallo-hydrolase, partial [Planctomycetota bacterium]|nr:MBL fold metallo-hydrolase [Planctomycetota bacterium]
MGAFKQLDSDLFVWTDTCNVYVLRDGNAGMLIDLGDGSVLDHLGELGITSLEWVLFTHHHREQCQGGPKLEPFIARGTQVAAPEAEREIFENPLKFRRMRPTLNDQFSVYGASYVRVPLAPIKISKTFKRMDDFAWRGREFWCVHIGGHSPGMMAYCLPSNGKFTVFCGDLMRSGAKMQTWYDSEFDYGFAKGLYELANNSAQIAGYDPALLLPSHGAPVKNARAEINEYTAKLRRLGELYVRGYEINRFANCDQDNVSRPSVVPHLWQLSKHLFKFRGPDYWVNFAMIISDSGKALLVDCGLFDRKFLDTALERAKERLGLKSIDAIFVTHMHGDHALDAEHIRQKWGAKLWTMHGIADTFERAWDYDLAALLPAYTDRSVPAPGPLKFDRVLRDGDVIQWEGFTFVVDWMPGQTKYHACLHGEIDGKTVAFTGDNIFASTVDPRQGGNEAVVARNGAILEEGYLYAASYLHGIAPDLIIGGHCWALGEPRGLIERYQQRASDLRDAFQALSPEDDYRYMFDPYWVQAHPYRVIVQPGGEATVALRVRNFREREQTHRVDLVLPPGISATPAFVEGKQNGPGISETPIKLKATADAKRGLQLVALEITRDGQRHGQLFDFIVHVGEVQSE